MNNLTSKIKDKEINNISFDVNPKPSEETIKALEEAQEIINNPEKYPGYNNINDLKKALLDDK